MTLVTQAVNTLAYDEALCIGCGMCAAVCPHGVFALAGRQARVVRGEACIECGACQRNCAVGAIAVQSGVGCAQAMIYAALTGRDTPTCGPDCRSESRSGGACC
jgi:NAD-dependent dihydropyrimidine dehydrogenase PreA subunit